jgi:hypothetical protein
MRSAGDNALVPNGKTDLRGMVGWKYIFSKDLKDTNSFYFNCRWNKDGTSPDCASHEPSTKSFRTPESVLTSFMIEGQVL